MCFSKLSVVYDLSSTQINQINNLYIPNISIIKEYFEKISGKQLTIEEIKNGSALENVLKNIDLITK